MQTDDELDAIGRIVSLIKTYRTENQAIYTPTDMNAYMMKHLSRKEYKLWQDTLATERHQVRASPPVEESFDLSPSPEPVNQLINRYRRAVYERYRFARDL